MARNRSVVGEDDGEGEINLSPMIDCIFILLIFFIVATVFVEEKGLPVEKPDATAALSLEERDDLLLEITADGRVLFDDSPIAISDVASQVKSFLRDPDTPVVIKSHGNAKHGTFIAVWDAAVLGGAQALSFNTVH